MLCRTPRHLFFTLTILSAFGLVFHAAAQDDAVETVDSSASLRIKVRDAESGEPVVGTWVGTHASNYPENGGEWRLYPISDDLVHTDGNGRAVINLEDDPGRPLLLWAWHRDRDLVGSIEVVPENFGKSDIELILQPARRVVGEIASESLAALGREVTWTNVYVVRNGHLPLHYSSVNGRFEFILPTGNYEIFIHGADLAHFNYDLYVPSGTGDFEIGTINVPASRLATLYGKPAPEFRQLKGWLYGEPTTLDQLRGQYVLLDFWGYWCGPCIAAMPELMLIHDALGNRGLTIIGIHDDSIDSIEDLELRLMKVSNRRWDGRRIPFRVALDGGGRVPIPGSSNTGSGATTAAYGIKSFPTQVLIGPDGRVLEKFHARSPDEAIRRLAELIGTEPVPPDWREELNAAYRLDEDEILRIVEPPFVPAREAYFEEFSLRRNQEGFGAPTHAVWTWDDDSLEGYSLTPERGHEGLESVLGALSDWSVDRYYIEGAQDLLDWQPPGDVVVRSDVPLKVKFKAFAYIVSGIRDEEIRIVPRVQEEDAVVVTGTYEFQPLDEDWQPMGVHIYTDHAGEEYEFGVGGTVAKLCRSISYIVGLPFVDETESSGDKLYWFYHSSAYLKDATEAERERLLPILLENLTKQTGLQFTIERRPITRWYVERIR